MLAPTIKKLFRRAGFDLARHRPSFVDLMRRNSIGTVLDVGANEGQYGREIRDLGFTGRIISFEPIASVFEKLRRRAAGDPMWDVHHMALAESDGERDITVSDVSVFSSFRKLSDYSAANFTGARAARTETVRVSRLDSFLRDHPLDLGATYLKIDTQGFEKEVLVGAGEALRRIRLVQAELALRQLYAGQEGWMEMVHWMEERGFRIAMAKENGYDHERAELLELDMVFLNGR